MANDSQPAWLEQEQYHQDTLFLGDLMRRVLFGDGPGYVFYGYLSISNPPPPHLTIDLKIALAPEELETLERIGDAS